MKTSLNFKTLVTSFALITISVATSAKPVRTQVPVLELEKLAANPDLLPTLKQYAPYVLIYSAGVRAGARVSHELFKKMLNRNITSPIEIHSLWAGVTSCGLISGIFSVWVFCQWQNHKRTTAANIIIQSLETSSRDECINMVKQIKQNALETHKPYDQILATAKSRISELETAA